LGGRGVDIWRFVREHEAAWERERLLIIVLNARQHVLGVGEVPLIGTPTERLRPLFRDVPMARAGAIIGLHNHPKTTRQSAKRDQAITQRLQQVADQLRLPLLGYLSFCRGQYRTVNLRELV